MQKSYISAEEHKKCRKVVAAFNEAFEGQDLLVFDAGRFGFVKLQYYVPDWGFDSVTTYRSSKEMFEGLWQEWFYLQLLDFAKETPMSDLRFEDIFKCMPREMQEEYEIKMQEFMKKAGCNFVSLFPNQEC